MFFSSLYNYRKARRKEKDGDQSSNDTKLYLEESVLERKLTDANLNTIIELPAGLDYNEWLASHSKYLFKWKHTSGHILESVYSLATMLCLQMNNHLFGC